MQRQRLGASKGCEACRKHHYRCDGQLPRCDRCIKGGRACIRGQSSIFRHHTDSESDVPDFARTQEWVKLSSARVQFIDETTTISSGSETNNDKAEPTVHAGNNEITSGPMPELPTSGHTLQARHRNSEAIQATQGQRAAHGHAAPESPAVNLSTAGKQCCHSVQEVMLLRHFIDHLAVFFDSIDNDHQFATEVPIRARSNRMLFAAILALSARHLNRSKGSVDDYVSNEYLQESLQSLRPALQHNTATTDKTLLAATVVLRMLEEMDVPFVGADLQGHLLGTQAIIQVQGQNALNAVLGRTAYWVAFRQDLFRSLSTRRRMLLSLPPELIDRSMHPADDVTWAKRALAHCGEVINYAFGDQDSGQPAYQNLLQYSSEWSRLRPSSFDTFFTGNEDTREGCLQDIQLHMPYHVVSIQYHTLAHALLIAHDPNIPTVGLERRAATEARDSSIKADVRSLCSIGASNPHVPPAMLVASMGIALFGDRFDSIAGQQTLNDILIKTEDMHGWPTTTAREQLLRTWCWPLHGMLST